MLRALKALEKRASTCTKCPLAKTRTNVVYGVGSARIKIMFIGEAPGRDEDAQGIPFVGRAGQLLTKIIASMGYDRDDVYIANVLKCRPPENRDPHPSEVEACSPYLLKQIEIIEPKIICALGLHAAHLLLNVRTPMNKLRGGVHLFRGTKVIPTYHPAACLRYPSLKRQVWEDMQFLKREYESS
jgi:DNA polymerase